MTDRENLPPRWYVAQTQPHREFSAQRHLAAQGFRTFLPSHWKTVRHARRFRTVKAPFFPGYMFVELTIGRDRWRSVNGTFGVARLIMEGDRPKPVPAGVVEALLSLGDQGGTVSFQDNLRVGELVRFLSGPLVGLIGKMIKLTAVGRVQVLLEIMGNHVLLSAKEEALAPVV